MKDTTNDWNIDKITSMVLFSLKKANNILRNLKNEGIKEVHDEKVVDISTKGDRTISDNFLKYLKKIKFPAIFHDEENGTFRLVNSPVYTMALDDIDGTDNYHRGREILPHCTIITIFDSITPCFEDALVAGIIEHNSKNIWLAIRGKGVYLNGIKVKNSGKKVLDKRTLIIIDHMATENDIKKLLNIYPPASWLKDFGSAGLHLAGISSGIFDGYISSKNKAHELGAGYLLVKEGGGVIVDFEGKPLDNLKYDFNSHYEVLAAATIELKEEILKKIK